MRQLKQELALVRSGASVPATPTSDFEGESLMLTGDLNVAVVEWIAQYRVADPFKYLFKLRMSPRPSASAMNEASGVAIVRWTR